MIPCSEDGNTVSFIRASITKICRERIRNDIYIWLEGVCKKEARSKVKKAQKVACLLFVFFLT
ncbi:hypothetical protein B6U79_01590 [Candidatus Bathyarchaeota archaeon ex4484_231]|nr:MAG: hypothetical protein B6U79_01590 [Candidatus Bathyarchaeota archaeon ex4484_231]